MMKSILTRFDEIMSAVTFAEAGEFDTARAIMDKSGRRAAMADGKCPHCGRDLDIDATLHAHKASAKRWSS
jgi:hypothetical protein